MVKLGDTMTLIDHAVYKLLTEDSKIKVLYMWEFDGSDWSCIDERDIHYFDEFYLDLPLSLKYGIKVYLPQNLNDNNY